ncbi:hypothetical protein PV325_012186 [Microctonus aethiopoides]|nr:hypothetical protein PV325_012186 [Microctonus aethiopoides]
MHPERPKSKLMLDKSSMTGDVFNIKNDPDLNDENESVDRVFELIELFPNIPREYLSEIYEKCMKNFDWTVEVLLDGVPDDVTIKVPNETDVADDIINPESPSMLNNDTIYCEETNSCDMDLMKNQTSIEYFNEYYLDKHDGIEIDVKSLNDMDYVDNVEADIFDDASLHLTESDNQQELTESEKSPEPEETIELNLGCEFVRTLENQFGNPDFHMPDGFQPIISIKKSIAQELYALWIESMYQQLNVRHEQLDQMIAKDAEFAKSLEREMEMEEARGSSSVQCESDVPNLNEIMDMELALASYKNELKSILVNDKPEDMASRLSRQMLHESIPDMDPEIFDDILKAHNGNFKETFDIIESNTGRSITPCDTFKKSAHNVSERMKEESMHDNLLKSRSSAPIIVARSDSKCSDRSPHKSIVTKVANSRQEAQRQFSLRIDNFNKAAEAYRRGYPQVAAYYSQVARLHSKNIQTVRSDVASALVKDQIFGDNDTTLDLHYLYVTEALQALDEFLDYHLGKLAKSNRRKSSILYIITGRGARSNNRTSKIKPAVSKRLLIRNIRFSEVNPGCLKINLYRKDAISD